VDDRAPLDQWEHAPADTRLLILEGWCVGARPQSAEALVDPVNDLERDEDPTGAGGIMSTTSLPALIARCSTGSMR
jgi:pantothenate kinase-related protein Tda10